MLHGKYMKKFLMLICATLLSSNRAWSDGAQVLSWTGRGLSMAMTGIPGALAFGWGCFGEKQKLKNDSHLQKFMGIVGALLLLETAYKSSWYFSKPDCGTCAANNNNAQKQPVE